jgi:hypothetical protein
MKTDRMFVVFALVLTLNSAKAQNAAEIVNKHIQAIGGRQKLLAINSIITENTVNLMGNDVPGKITISDGKGYRNEFAYNGSLATEVITETEGWQLGTLYGGKEVFAKEKLTQYEDFIYIFPLLHYGTNGSTLEITGKEKLKGSTVYKLLLTNKNKTVIRFFIDSASSYIVQTVRSSNYMGNTLNLTTTYSHFKQADNGVIFPMLTETNYGDQFMISYKTNKLHFNEPVDAAIFILK